jgi:hypothetical protein
MARKRGRQTVSFPEHGARGPELPDHWRQTFLDAYEQTGTLWKAAKIAGLSAKTVKRHMEADPDFADQAEERRQLYADGLEIGMDGLFRKGNVVAGIVMLKKHRPADFIERAQIQSVNVNVDIQVAEAREFLHALASSPRAELQALRALPSLPAHEATPTESTPQARP